MGIYNICVCIYIIYITQWKLYQQINKKKLQGKVQIAQQNDKFKVRNTE